MERLWLLVAVVLLIIVWLIEKLRSLSIIARELWLVDLGVTCLLVVAKGIVRLSITCSRSSRRMLMIVWRIEIIFLIFILLVLLADTSSKVFEGLLWEGRFIHRDISGSLIAGIALVGRIHILRIAWLLLS